MAKSPAHRWGQIIGDVLEDTVKPILQEFAKKHSLYLDKKGPRPCRSGLKCQWKDLNGNWHDLDFVLERGGTKQAQGVPAAFIEVAWRRYTKHSRNKAQEIQGAIVPLAETFKSAGPFKGAILAGVFTGGALNQLKSLGFTLLFFPYDAIVAAFRKSGIDAAFDQNTRDSVFQKKVDAYERLSPRKRGTLLRELLAGNDTALNGFMNSLEQAITRKIKRIIVLPLHGRPYEIASIKDAVDFVETYQGNDSLLLVKYEIQITYNNGDKISAEFNEKLAAISFLRTFLPTPS